MTGGRKDGTHPRVSGIFGVSLSLCWFSEGEGRTQGLPRGHDPSMSAAIEVFGGGDVGVDDVDNIFVIEGRVGSFFKTPRSSITVLPIDALQYARGEAVQRTHVVMPPPQLRRVMDVLATHAVPKP